MQKHCIGWIYFCLITSSGILPILCYPSLTEISQVQPHIVLPEGRKFAEKPNAAKKVPPPEDRNDLDDIQTNQIPQETGFSWSNVIGMVMQLLFNSAGATGPSKSDSLDTDQGVVTQSPWTNLLSVGLKILTAFLGGGPVVGSDGIDKVDNSSPMQGILTAVLSTVLGTKDQEQVATMAKQAGEFINIVVTLLDALKTSFSHRSMAARSLGKKDSISDAAIAGLTMFKGYMRTMRTSDDICMQKFVCEANKECTDDLNQSNAIYCQLGTYATSLILQKSSTSPFETFLEAGRRGRSKEDCRQIYLTCNEA
ncbi:hypothetical protein PGB90_009334 [Kerria lacca]